MRASLYVRLSREANPDNTSLESMTAGLRNLCAREAFTEVALHVDNGRSGGYRDRPEFLGWLEDARQGRADVLVAWHVDRMTREGANVAGILLDVVEGKDPQTGRPTGRPVRLMDAQGLDSAGSEEAFRWQFVVKAEVARAERERTRERNKRAAQALALAGRWHNGAAPYGYRISEREDRPGKYLVLEPAEAEAVREAANRVLAGQPLGRVARWMTDTHAPRRAAGWSRVTLRQVLTGDTVLGYTKVAGALLRDEAGKPVQAWPAILTPAESATLRKLLEPAPDARKRGRHPARMLSGFLTCADCGSRLQVARRTKGEVTYRCMTRSNGGKCTNCVVISAPALETYLEGLVLKTHGEAPVFEEHVIVDDSGSAIAVLDEAMAAVLAQMAEDPTPELLARLQTLKAERDTAKAIARAIGQRTETVRTDRTFADDWAALEHLDDKRRLLASVLERVAVKPGRRGPVGIDPERLEVSWSVRPGLVAVVGGALQTWAEAEELHE